MLWEPRMKEMESSSGGSLQYHLENPGVSTDEYLQQRRVVFGQEVESRLKIYLDTKYWVLLRDAHFGRPKNDAISQLLSLLRNAVVSGDILCPIGTEAYLEIHHQTDRKSLRATAALMDELSCRTAIVELAERMQLEAEYFFRETISQKSLSPPIRECIWTRPVFIVGHMHPHIGELDSETNLAVQKAFIDEAWDMPLEEMVTAIPSSGLGTPTNATTAASDLNTGKASSTEDYRSFDELFLLELRGGLCGHIAILESVLDTIVEQIGGQKKPVDFPKDGPLSRVAVNAIYEQFRRNRVEEALPSFRIQAGCHAIVRWDQRRKYKFNDLADIRHATAAIPYCDVFLTERSLKHILADKKLRFAELFPCKVIAHEAEAVDIISTMLQNRRRADA